MKAIVLRSTPLWLAAAAGFAAAGCALPMGPLAHKVPATLAPPSGEVLTLMVAAAGTQIYECRGTAGAAPAWTFVAPEADLYDDKGRVVGKHYAGPSWEWPDGSKVKGEVTQRADGTAPGSIPWLLLAATSTGGPGVLAATTSIQRLDTRGGVAPAGGCTAQTVGQQARVYYSANYAFYARR